MKTYAIILALLTGALRAGDKYSDIMLKDGTVLKDVEVTAVTGRGVKVTHRDGGGLITLAQLPPHLQKKYAGDIEAQKEGAQEKVDEKVKAAAQLHNQAVAREAAEKGIEFKVTGVKEGTGFFRYFFSAHELTGKKCEGTLFVRCETPEHPAGIDKKEIKLTLAANGNSSGSIDWHTGPPGGHGKDGVTRLQWVLRTASDHRYEGSAPVPENPTGTLAADVMMAD